MQYMFCSNSSRFVNAAVSLFEDRVDVAYGSQYTDFEIETVTFVQPRVYMASFAADGKGFRRKDPPVPPRPKRLNAFTWNPTLRDVRDVDIGTQFKEQVEPKLGPQFQPPTRDLMHWGWKQEGIPSDPVSPNSTEYTYEYEYDSSSDGSQDDERPIQVKSEGDCKVEHAGFMFFSVEDSDSDVIVRQDPQDPMHEVAFTSHVMLNERTTMGRRHRRTFLEGIDTMNRQDALMRSSFGLIPSDSVENPEIVIFTSHPLVFQDQFNVYDVGPNAEYLEDGDRTQWTEMFEGYELIVIAIEYQDGNFALNHRDLLFELELFCQASGVRFLHIDIAHTRRWEDHANPQVPYLTDSGIGFTSNCEDLYKSLEDWSTNRVFDDVLSWDFSTWLSEWTVDKSLDDQMFALFPAAVADEIEEGLGENPLVQIMDADDRPVQDPIEDLIAEETLVDEYHIPGLPEDEQERRRLWKKLPQRVRIGVRWLHRQFGHVPKQVMINLLRAAKARKEFIDAVRLHRCETCEKTAPKKPTHKVLVSLPGEYSFNHTLGIDVLEVVDAEGNPYQVLNMVCVGTTFQLA